MTAVPITSRNPLRGLESNSDRVSYQGVVESPTRMGIQRLNAIFEDASRVKRRRDLMLDDEPLHLRAWDSRQWVQWKIYLLWLGYILSGGILALIASWPWLKKPCLRFKSRPCSDPKADFIVVEVGIYGAPWSRSARQT